MWGIACTPDPPHNVNSPALHAGMKPKRTIREEANALTCYAFRNGKLELLHAGKHSELLDNPELSRITDGEMKLLMIEASEKLAEALLLRDTDRDRYDQLIEWMCTSYTPGWVKDEPAAKLPELPKKIAKSLSVILSREMGGTFSTADILAAFKRIMNRKPYGLYSPADWAQLEVDLRIECSRKPRK